MSRITEEQRQRLYEQAQDLDPRLGDLFKDGCVLTMDDINAEIQSYYRTKDEETKRWQAYHGNLGMLLCFPEQNHKL